MPEFASNAKANTGVALGGVGTGLGVLNTMANCGGILGNLFGCNNRGYCCSDDEPVNRYEAAQAARIAELETEVKLRDANTFTDQKLGDFRDYVDKRFQTIDKELCNQAVMNQKTADAFELVKGDIISTQKELYCAINRERDERCCGDNSIVSYANATFYPKQIADVAVTAETTPQHTYNPVYNCGNCCDNRGHR